MKLFCLILTISLEIEASRDFIYTEIQDIDVVAGQEIRWTHLNIDIIQYSAPKFFRILQFERFNIHREASNLQIPNFLSDVQENFKYKFTLKVLHLNSVTQKIVYFIDIRKPRSQNGKCDFVNNIYLVTNETYAFYIGIKFKCCLMRYVSFGESSFEAAKMQNYFYRDPGGIYSDKCQEFHYKYSPQLKQFLCLCQYDGRPCETFIGCVAYGKICSNRGFCVINKPFSKCRCIDNYGSYHCEKNITACESAPRCHNDGTCIDVGDSSWYCECPKEFTGKSCEIRNVCHNYLCYNQGKCVIENSNPKCTCLSGYIGKQCEFEISKCPKCLNNGTCVSPDLGYNYICQCPRGFVGLLCEFRRKSCNGNKVCYNYGKCFKGRRGEETCFCQNKYYGNSCEKYADCITGYFGPNCRQRHTCNKIGRPCLNSGKCVIVNHQVHLCKCKPGYHGYRCQHRHCIQNSDCLNHGTCEYDGSQSICICSLSLTGKFCQYYNECYGHLKCGQNGICIKNSNGTFNKCVCNYGWKGMFCDEKMKFDKSEL